MGPGVWLHPPTHGVDFSSPPSFLGKTEPHETGGLCLDRPSPDVRCSNRDVWTTTFPLSYFPPLHLPTGFRVHRREEEDPKTSPLHGDVWTLNVIETTISGIVPIPSSCWKGTQQGEMRPGKTAGFPGDITRGGVREMEDLAVIFRHAISHRRCKSCDREELIKAVLQGGLATHRCQNRISQDLVRPNCNRNQGVSAWNYNVCRVSPLTAGEVETQAALGAYDCLFSCFQSREVFRELQSEKRIDLPSTFTARPCHRTTVTPSNRQHEDHAGRPHSVDSVEAKAPGKSARQRDLDFEFG